MVFRATPQLGPGLEDVYDAPAYFDGQLVGVIDAEVSPQLGTVERGSDGGEYFWVQASADIAATATTGTEVDMTFATHSVATKAGAGGFWTPPATAIKEDQFFWVRRGAWNANPA